jgi:plastocyanin
MRARLLTLAAASIVFGTVGAACGGSSTAPPSATGAAADVEATTTQDATATAARPRARRIDPRRNGLEIALGEWAVQAEASVIRPGPVTFVITNRGKMAHGFEIEADEDSSGPGGDDDRHKAESRLLAPGETVRLRLDLPAGVYKIECFVDGHDDLGMETLLEVRPGAPLVRENAATGRRNAVAITGFAFRPAEIAVRAGQAVTWTNEDPADHTVTHEGGSFGSKTLDQAGRFRMVFTRPGTYRYICALHPEMRGTVVVKA